LHTSRWTGSSPSSSAAARHFSGAPSGRAGIPTPSGRAPARPLGADGRPDAVDAVGLAELPLGLLVGAVEQLLGDVDVEPLDRIEPQRHVAVDPHSAGGHRQGLVAGDGVDDALQTVDGRLPGELLHGRPWERERKTRAVLAGRGCQHYDSRQRSWIAPPW
jgi:hypothetical protein